MPTKFFNGELFPDCGMYIYSMECIQIFNLKAYDCSSQVLKGGIHTNGTMNLPPSEYQGNSGSYVIL